MNAPTNPTDPTAAMEGGVLDQLMALGVSRDALRRFFQDRAVVPTVAEFLPTVEAATTAGARGTYRFYWNLLVEQLGDRPLDQVRTSDLTRVALLAETNAMRRANHRGGRHAKESCIAAMRKVFNVAVDDEIIERSPAAKLTLPRRPKSRRRALSAAEVTDLWHVSGTTGNDPHLDQLLVRFHLETGARRSASIALRVEDLDFERQCVRLHEKFDEEWWQPCSATLLDALADHAQARGASAPGDQVLRRARGRALTDRRHDYIVSRWHQHLDWAAKAGVSTHWLRHSAIDAVRNIAGESVAQRFAGHAVRSGSQATTAQYGPATEAMVARAVAVMTGEPHPLAT